MQPIEVDTVVLDVDGTLVDSVYTHVQAWLDAFLTIGTVVPAWHIHRAIGMGGDRLVAEVAGQRVEDAMGDRIRELHDKGYESQFGSVRAFDRADDLLRLLHGRGFTVALASSGTAEQTDRALELLAADEVARSRVSSASVSSSKPAPDLIEAAMRDAGASRAVVVGDSVWDVAAAQHAGVPAVGLRSGGFCDTDLIEAGCVSVFESVADLVERFDESGLTYVSG